MSAINRRMFLAVASGAAASGDVLLFAQALRGMAHRVSEFSLSSFAPYEDPFADVEVNVRFSANGRDWVVPAYWAGENTWRVRFAPPQPGTYEYETISSDRSNPDLHGKTGTLEVVRYEGKNPLYLHGPLRVSENERYLQHADGTPFFWLGDTWWLGLTRRLRWPEEFRQLAADRAAKGFNVIQIVAGLYPDMPSFDPRGANEAGFPWQSDYARINPAYFDMADLRIQHLVAMGMVPCILGCWGYYLPILGLEKMKQHWRYLIARWGSYPVVWCLAGEGSMPWYLSKNPDAEREAQKRGWSEVGRYVRSIDPYHHPVTIHPSRSARETVSDASVLDFDMLQTGHNDRRSIPRTVQQVTQAVAAKPTMPVINGEVCYEGILGASRQDIQRFMFWASVLSGTCGYTYGANGIWQVNRPDNPFGPSPHGRTWGNTPWQEAAALPGSEQVGMAAKLMRQLPWWRLEPHPEWVEPHWTEKDYELPFAAGSRGGLRVIYIPTMWNPPKVVGLDRGKVYRAYLFDLMTGKRHHLENVTPAADGTWQMGFPPNQQDWVLVLQQRA